MFHCLYYQLYEGSLLVKIDDSSELKLNAKMCTSPFIKETLKRQFFEKNSVLDVIQNFHNLYQLIFLRHLLI